MSNKEATSGDLALSLFGIVLAAGLVFYGALVLQMLWNWFAAPLGAPALAYWHAMGVGLLATHLRGLRIDYAKRTPVQSIGRIIETGVAVSILLGVAALVRLGVPS